MLSVYDVPGFGIFLLKGGSLYIYRTTRGAPMKYVSLLAVSFLVLGLGCSDDDGDGSTQKKVLVSLTFNGPVYEGNWYSGYLPATDHAIWIEDENNSFVTTLQLNESIVKVGEHGAHLEHVPAWTAASGESDDSLSQRVDTANGVDIPLDYDGITAASVLFEGAPPPDTTIEATWDLTDYTGAEVAAGTYRFCAEVANIQKDSAATNPPPEYVISETCCGTVEVEDGPVTDASPTQSISSLTAEWID